MAWTGKGANAGAPKTGGLKNPASGDPSYIDAGSPGEPHGAGTGIGGSGVVKGATPIEKHGPPGSAPPPVNMTDIGTTKYPSEGPSKKTGAMPLQEESMGKKAKTPYQD